MKKEFESNAELDNMDNLYKKSLPDYVKQAIFISLTLLVFLVIIAILLKSGLIADNEKAESTSIASDVKMLENINSVSMNFINENCGNVIDITSQVGLASDSYIVSSDIIDKKVYVILKRDSIETADLLDMTADDKYISQVLLKENEDLILLEILLDDYYNVSYSNLSNNAGLRIELLPIEQEDYIVLLSVESDDEKSQNIANEITRKLDNDSIKIVTAYSDINSENNFSINMIDFMNKCDIDIFIGIESSVKNIINNDYNGIESPTNKNEVTSVFYNGDYFIPEHNSVTLADQLEREVVKASGDKAGGLILCPNEDYVLKNAKVPAARIKLGYRKNIDGNLNVFETKYEENVANAIVTAILSEIKDN